MADKIKQFKHIEMSFILVKRVLAAAAKVSKGGKLQLEALSKPSGELSKALGNLATYWSRWYFTDRNPQKIPTREEILFLIANLNAFIR
jgi:hypothetical protein